MQGGGLLQTELFRLLLYLSCLLVFAHNEVVETLVVGIVVGFQLTLSRHMLIKHTQSSFPNHIVVAFRELDVLRTGDDFSLKYFLVQVLLHILQQLGVLADH